MKTQEKDNSLLKDEEALVNEADRLLTQIKFANAEVIDYLQELNDFNNAQPEGYEIPRSVADVAFEAVKHLGHVFKAMDTTNNIYGLKRILPITFETILTTALGSGKDAKEFMRNV